MSVLPILIIVIGSLLIIAWFYAPRTVAWADEMTRLKPGTGAEAEWIAPPAVLHAVRQDFLATQTWATNRTLNWGHFAHELPDYLSGHYLSRQTRALQMLTTTSRAPRLALEERVTHTLTPRYFSSDGLRCLLIDWQTERLLITRQYWSQRVVQQQRLDDTAYVFQMVYDREQHRWKIERLVQELPLGWGQPRTSKVALTTKLPARIGRDS